MMTLNIKAIFFSSFCFLFRDVEHSIKESVAKIGCLFDIYRFR